MLHGRIYKRVQGVLCHALWYVTVDELCAITFNLASEFDIRGVIYEDNQNSIRRYQQ